MGSRENDRRSKKQLALCQTAALTVQPLFKFQCFAVPNAWQYILAKVHRLFWHRRTPRQAGILSQHIVGLSMQARQML